MIYYVIPARKGSKGFPGKNRKLFCKTADMLIGSGARNVIVTTDDPCIIEKAAKYNFDIIQRGEDLSNDTASMKDVLLDVIKKREIEKDDIIILLYLTYPQRDFTDIVHGINYFENNGAMSMLCAFETDIKPHLYIYEDGSPVVEHDLYRRQDYPRVLERSHFLFIAYAGEVKKLGKNLYNDNTAYMKIQKKVDVDTEKDFLEAVK